MISLYDSCKIFTYLKFALLLLLSFITLSQLFEYDGIYIYFLPLSPTLYAQSWENCFSFSLCWELDDVRRKKNYASQLSFPFSSLFFNDSSYIYNKYQVLFHQYFNYSLLLSTCHQMQTKTHQWFFDIFFLNTQMILIFVFYGTRKLNLSQSTAKLIVVHFKIDFS